MKETGMKTFISSLLKEGELNIINEKVTTDLEITEIADRISKQSNGGKALLFTNTGTQFPVLINALGSQKRIEIAFKGRKPAEISKDFLALFSQMTGPSTGLISQFSKLPMLGRLGRIMPKKSKKQGACQEFVSLNPNLTELPILKCWPADGGAFITLPLVHTTDPVNGIRNVGMYRLQVLDNQSTGMHWHMHKTGARHFNEYKKLGKKMPIAVALGGDPIYTYCATAPLPDGIDEYLLAGYIRNKPVKLVKCVTQELWVPNDADFIIEGFVDPEEELVTEGPFGDHTGFYSLADKYPKFHVTAITHRRNAVYPATIVGIPPQEDAWIGKATEDIFLEPIRIAIIQELIDFHLPVAGVAHNIGIFNIKADYPGQGRKILNSVWGAGQMMFTKFGIVLDQTKNLRNYKELAREICEKVEPLTDIITNSGPLDILDHTADRLGEGGKMGIDATGKNIEESSLNFEEFNEEVQQFRSSNPEILSINTEMIQDSIPIGYLRLNKTMKDHCRQLSSDLLGYETLKRIKFWIISNVEIENPSWFEIAWIVGAHVDPVRDCWISTVDEGKKGVLFIDASRKSRIKDGFPRDWPNPVVMNTKTIELVNKKWETYDIGPLVNSPSIRYLPMSLGESAVATEYNN